MLAAVRREEEAAARAAAGHRVEGAAAAGRKSVDLVGLCTAIVGERPAANGSAGHEAPPPPLPVSPLRCALTGP